MVHDVADVVVAGSPNICFSLQKQQQGGRGVELGEGTFDSPPPLTISIVEITAPQALLALVCLFIFSVRGLVAAVGDSTGEGAWWVKSVLAYPCGLTMNPHPTTPWLHFQVTVTPWEI